MNEHQNLPLQIGLLCGTALGIVVVSIGIIRYITGMILEGDQTLSYVYWCIFTLTVFLSVFWFKKMDPLSFSIRQTLKIGIFAGLVSGLMYTLYIVILNHYIDPGLASKIIHFNEQALLASNPGMSKEAIAESFSPMKMNTPVRGLVYTLVCMFFGIVHSALSTIAVKRLKD